MVSFGTYAVIILHSYYVKSTTFTHYNISSHSRHRGFQISPFNSTSWATIIAMSQDKTDYFLCTVATLFQTPLPLPLYENLTSDTITTLYRDMNY